MPGVDVKLCNLKSYPTTSERRVCCRVAVCRWMSNAASEFCLAFGPDGLLCAIDQKIDQSLTVEESGPEIVSLTFHFDDFDEFAGAIGNICLL